MRALRTILLCLLALSVSAPAGATPGVLLAVEVETPRPLAVVAHIDTGVNPYSDAFRDTSPLARKHPSTYIPGFPASAQALKLSLDLPYDKAVEQDADIWKTVKRGELYWIPGTKIIGAISFGAGGGNCPAVDVPPANAVGGSCPENVILDDHGHGSMTGSRATGIAHSLAPDARLVTIEGLGAQSVQWAADQGWIDVQTNSWVNLVPAPIPGGTTDAFADATTKTFTMVASGNGAAFLAGFAPTPTYFLSTAPPGVILVGGHDNGKMTLWAGAPPHVVADAYAGFTAIVDSTEEMRPDPIACCTSAASPYAAGGAAALIQEARRILKDRTTGADDGVLATGKKCAVAKGPLVDGDFTLDELRDLFFHTAQPHPVEGKDDGEVHWTGGPAAPTHPEYGIGGNPFCQGCTTTPVPWSAIPNEVDAYQLIGYGGINEHSVKLGKSVLQGKAEMLVRDAADAQYELDQSIRETMHTGGTSGEFRFEFGELVACAVTKAN
jgi:Subtilase family